MKDALIHMIQNKETADNFEYCDNLEGTDMEKINNKINKILKNGPP